MFSTKINDFLGKPYFYDNICVVWFPSLWFNRNDQILTYFQIVIFLTIKTLLSKMVVLSVFNTQHPHRKKAFSLKIYLCPINSHISLNSHSCRSFHHLMTHFYAIVNNLNTITRLTVKKLCRGSVVACGLPIVGTIMLLSYNQFLRRIIITHAIAPLTFLKEKCVQVETGQSH